MENTALKTKSIVINGKLIDKHTFTSEFKTDAEILMNAIKDGIVDENNINDLTCSVIGMKTLEDHEFTSNKAIDIIHHLMLKHEFSLNIRINKSKDKILNMPNNQWMGHRGFNVLGWVKGKSNGSLESNIEQLSIHLEKAKQDLQNLNKLEEEDKSLVNKQRHIWWRNDFETVIKTINNLFK